MTKKADNRSIVTAVKKNPQITDSDIISNIHRTTDSFTPVQSKNPATRQQKCNKLVSVRCPVLLCFIFPF